jgi:diguanylate cyclase (GGDEF)-like protein
MVRKTTHGTPSGFTILVVDDDRDYLESTGLLLEREGHEVVLAGSGPEALDLLRSRHVDLALLDYHMPKMTGAQMLLELRRFDPELQVILTTGYASEHPPRELLRSMEIQAYFDKSEGPEKLLLWADVGLKAARTIHQLNKNRLGLAYILEATPKLHRIQPLDTLLQGILLQVAGLLGAVHSFVAVLPDGAAPQRRDDLEGFLALVGEDADLVLHAGTGRFARSQKLTECLEPARVDWLRQSLQRGEVQISEGSSVVPLRVGEQSLGVIYVDKPAVRTEDLELLRLFANQAAAGINNVQLYELASMDTLTGTFSRRVLEQWLLRELRKAFRNGRALTLLMVDIDDMKRINDAAGHLAGDRALVTLAESLKSATRGGDIVARYGGDEFCVVLPETTLDGGNRVAARILHNVETRSPEVSNDLRLRCSLGMATLTPHQFDVKPGVPPERPGYFQEVATKLVSLADNAMYRAKRAGGGRFEHAEEIGWNPITPVAPQEVTSREPAD